MSAMAMAPTMPRAYRVGGAGGTAERADRNRSALRLTGRGRVVLWVLALMLVALAVLLASRAAADGPARAQEVERHVVQPGETMWQIAAEVAGPRQDVRDVVFDLVRLNELPDAGLMAGQVIVVPAG
jgi:LysM domain-containing protein